MPSKKSTQKISEPKARYAVDQKVFTIMMHRGRPEEIYEVMIRSRKRREWAHRDYLDKKIGVNVEFSYSVVTPTGMVEDRHESCLYPSFVEAAKVFAKSFLVTLK